MKRWIVGRGKLQVTEIEIQSCESNLAGAIHGQVVRDAKEIGPQIALRTTSRAQCDEQPVERLGHKILRGVRIPKQAAAVAEQRRAKGIVDLFKCARIQPAGSG